jgi:hypothetical protein
MKTAIHILAVATLCLAPGLSAAQSVATAQAPVDRIGILETEGELSPTVQLYVGRGDELSGRLRFEAAAREYRRAAEVARREGHLASGTSWKAATAYFSNGNLLGAAGVLDQLANEAAFVGDLQVEAQAIYYAAWLNGKAGRGAEAAARVARLEALLRSPYMPVAIRNQLNDWLRISKEVAAGN